MGYMESAIADDEAHSKKLLTNGTLLSWPGPEYVGVCKSLDAQK